MIVLYVEDTYTIEDIYLFIMSVVVIFNLLILK